MSDDEYEDWYASHAWNPARYPDLTIEPDLTPAAWLEPLLVPQSFEVWMTAPQGYEAYARIFFPYDRSGVDGNGEWYEEHVRWADLATANGRTVHALMEQETITGERNDGGQWTRNLSPGQFDALLPTLARHTSSSHGWFLLWEGFGNLNDQVFNDMVPKVSHSMRDYYLLRGPLGAYTHFSNDPNYWWPDDRAWCLCTDTDFTWSYMAGARECVDEVLALPVMDAVETKPDYPARSGMDVINDPDGTIPRSL
jgi:hypothetical protein